jgi:multiple sugar transport system permease protein
MNKKRLSELLRFAAVTLLTLIALTPILWTILSTLRPTELLIRGSLFPYLSELTFKNYRLIMEKSYLLAYMYNSFLYSSLSALASTVVGVAGGYGLSRFVFPGHKFILNMFIVIMMIPILVVLVPLYFILAKAGFLSPTALIIIYAAGNVPFSVWVNKTYIDSIPEQIDEAACIDGSGKLQNLWHLILPLALPGYMSTLIIVFVNGWNELVYASVLLTRFQWKPITTGMLGLLGQYGNNWGAMNTAAFLSCLPALVVFFLLQRYFIGGIVAGAIKE